MSEKNRTLKKSRYPILLPVVAAIFLLMSDCTGDLSSSLNNGLSPPPPVNQKNYESAVPEKTGKPLLAEKEETALSTNTDSVHLETLSKDGQRQEQKPVGTESIKASALTPHTAQENDPERRLAPIVSNKQPIKKTEDVNQKDLQTNLPDETLETGVDSVAQAVAVHQDPLEDNAGGALGDSFTEPVSGMEFILVKGGCFQMGSNNGRPYEQPAHEVCVDDFYLGKHEVTQMQWKIVMGRNNSYFRGDGNPVEWVTWSDAQKFASKLNSRSKHMYRLPTEAEWEYAARSGGQREVYAGTSEESSLQDFSWHQENSNRQAHAVGMKRANHLGLYDMSGNVWEWCSDWYGESYYENSPRNNPQGPVTGTYRVIRGGEWGLPGRLARLTYRDGEKPGTRKNDIGFRLAFTAPQP